MDDLEHSVQIAEQEWESFYEESDECFVEQVSLADLDDLGLSDTDEELSTKESVFPHQANFEEGAEAHSDGAGISWMESERLKENEDRVIFADGNLTKCECLAPESSTGGNNIPALQLQSNLEAVPLGQHDENSSKENSGPAVEKLSTSFISVQGAGNVGSSAGETVSKVNESSASKKEKERWFVTVNESPVKLRGSKSSQKKAKQKKKIKTMTEGLTAKQALGFVLKNQNTAAGEEAEKEANLNELERLLQRESEWRHHTGGLNKFNKETLCPSRCQEGLLYDVNKTREQNVSTPEIHTDSGLASSNLKDPQEPSNFQTDDPASHPSDSLLTSTSLVVNDNHSTKDYECMLRNTTDHLITDSSIGVNDDTANNESTLNVKSWKSTTPQNFINSKDPAEQQTRNIPFSQEIQNESGKNLEAAIDPACPVYALSAFWNEIEKLTINDILHLRTMSNTSPMQSQCNSTVKDMSSSEHNWAQNILIDDSDEFTDSDYFTQVHDGDCLSWEFSSLSDFDEMETPRGSPNLQLPNSELTIPELANLQLPPNLQLPNPEFPNPQLPNPEFPNPKLAKLQLPNPEFPNPKLANLQLPNPKLLKCEEHVSEQQPEQIRVNPELEMGDHLRKCLQEVPLILNPVKEVHNVFFTNNETDARNNFELQHITTPFPVLTATDPLDGQHVLMFSEILTKEIDAEGHPACFPDSRLCCSLVSFPYSQKLCVSETYDDFFPDDLFLPAIQDRTVPIFSTSYSAVRDLIFPLVNEFIELNIDDDQFPVKVMTRYSTPPEHSTKIAAIQNLYLSTSQNRDWKRCLSLRKFRFVGRGGNWYQKISSWMFPKDAKKAKTYDSGVQQIQVPMMHEDHKEVIQLIHQQMDHHALLNSKREDFLSSIKQADMCLVCIAFASWVLTSSNPESTDTWKAALLANISAISAIQYIGKYLKKEESDP